MNAISKLKNARTAQELASEIEPLAQALVTLADQTKEHLNEQQRMSKEHNENWIQAQTQTSQEWAEAAVKLKAAAHQLTDANNNIVKMVNGLQLRLIMISLMTSMMPILVLLIVFWIWLDPQIVAKDGIIWLGLQTSS